ncbi:chemotaxis protein CheA [Shewanella chilikensis]|uniref:histidine kinase n=1 Tax=Shewanella chilikensis TaxID=558541 RepID=A0ABX5PLY7_9GAMM|nr:chemotaxis protein CheA [Shewanella chilikensis]MCL1152635.1 chemotaxis protein CheA [Shewanella chilikensis]PYE57620.1 two-component system chemotaxis sensor kinase CheA [Shewanella chilikensis]GGZ40967.1 chemotaxis protein CheA [Shewanella chilikensis]
MAFDVDEEILQDFLIEAGEILELLQEQLVSLENNPEDTDLLNAIFRGFHTVKGGAGFLGLGPMVDVCHEAENTFDLLRTGKRSVNSELMDIILQALDTINTMFNQTQSGQEQEAADEVLLAKLKLLSSGAPLPSEQAQAETPAAVETGDESVDELFDGMLDSAAVELFEEPTSQPPETSNQSGAASIDEIDEAEFEALLDALHGSGKGPSAGSTPAPSSDATNSSDSASVSSSSDDITDDEFERLLDELHGKGQFAAAPAANSAVVEEAASASVDADEISDDEFEKLLDELHGKGAGPGAKASGSEPAVSQPSASQASTSQAAQSKAPAAATQKVTAATAKVEAPKAAAKPQAKSPAVAKEATPAKAAASVPQGETTVRVDTARLDEIMNMVGELVLVRNRLVSLGISREDEEMSKALANLDLVTSDLQGAVMKTRMQPIKKVFGRFPRVVRDLARSLNKEIDLRMIGEDTDLDKNLVEALADPLVHLVRNSVDHGIEMPDVREANGKPRTGVITLAASQEGDHILLKIEDDGAGMDAGKLKEIAISRGVLDEDSAARMSDQEAYNLIFAPGFSTKVEISDISGRGVGMDVVKTRITQLNGSVHIDSAKGKGTRLEIKVPLTLAIMPTLMVEVAKQVFALPLSSVNEIFHLDLTKTNIVDGQLTVIVREKAVPLFYLERWLSRKPMSFQHGDKKHGHVVIVQLGTMQIGFVVDALIGQEEVVIKPLGSMLHGTPGMAGATITSDGGIALILDVPGLLKHYAKSKR